MTTRGTMTMTKGNLFTGDKVDIQHAPSTRHKCKTGTMLDKKRTWKTLRENICGVLMGRQPDGKEGPLLDVTTDKVIA
jgi:hypothetical protein